MTKEIQAPFFGANDSEAKIESWLLKYGEMTNKGQIICNLETTKAVFEIESETNGFLYPLAKNGESVKTGQVIGFISQQKDFDPATHIKNLNNIKNENKKITKKAEIICKKNNIDLEDVIKNSGENPVTEKTVEKILEKQGQKNRRIGVSQGQKIGIIGGVSGGGASIVIESLLCTPQKIPVCIYDKDKNYHGKKIHGVPVVGGISLLQNDLLKQNVDSVVIAFNRDLVERDNLYKKLNKEKVPFANIIDPSAQIKSEVEIGNGNIILGNVYVGANSKLGNNNFISANVAFEHGNYLGSSCSFGPGVFTSGNVTIGDKVKFGTGIFVEPNLNIGSNIIISSGSIITADVPDNHVVRISKVQSLHKISNSK